jgi:RNA polymerase sigma-70 factor (ECF subfamily)
MSRDAFERLYAENARPLLGFLLYRTGDHALAEDIAADAFERVLLKRARFDPRRGSEKTWLYSIALNLLRDHARREQAGVRARDRASAVHVTPGERELESVEERDALGRALATLSEAEQDAIALRYGADLSLKEIARLSGEKPSTVESRVYRALERLRDELAGT